MSDEDRRDEALQKLGRMAEARTRETEDWWQAAEAGDQARLPEGAPPVDALRPLDDAERAKLTASLFGEPPADNVVDLKARRRRISRAVGGALAVAAAAAAVFVALPEDKTLPEYALVVRSGEKVMRSEAPVAGAYRYAPGSQVDVIVRPETTVEGEVHLSAVVVGADGAAKAWAGPVETKSGAFRVRGTFGDDVDLEPGAWRLVLTVSSKVAPDPVATWRAPPAGARILEHRFQLETAQSGAPPGDAPPLEGTP